VDTKTRSIRSLNTDTGNSSFIGELKATNASMFKGSAQKTHVWTSYDWGTIHQVYRDKKLVEEQTYFSGKNGQLRYPELQVIHILQQNDTIAWLSTNGACETEPRKKYVSFIQ
jgi:hypothetical protein